MTLAFSIGKWRGLYFRLTEYSIRLCLGFFAITAFRDDVVTLFDLIKELNLKAEAMESNLQALKNLCEVAICHLKQNSVVEALAHLDIVSSWDE